ncbi:uncharacterized protein SPSK_06064 [Sporothrix schenckii 1099-18]|uniref:Zn(2)-C6 fungal-type domain-containing protein n=2 Tax=Sporothrix schenckii TaxID=29908 RepID=U7PT67_SPOS1|nr:uncharacterized protein SPSK_06064 [Sporothrix schenckii 1099-18]ERS98136.1 hypothetical protein HMPREF1624_04916 [Sporothrix schenckii ATCC 58251]KJR89770.1 hypothetical protein SPSK_06064 [Sporothrix schenckii 1099-18]
MDSTRTTRRQTRTRTRTGCMTCRARKIKCDETATTCRNCTRAQLDCLRPDRTNASLHQTERVQLADRAVSAHDGDRFTQAGLQRRRAKRSCNACRRTKKRCGGERPQCMRCTDKDVCCVYDEPGEILALSQTTASPISPLPSVDLLADKVLVHRLCDAFFNEVAPLRCFGFLHRHTFLQEVDATDHPRDDPLLLAVCALATKTIAMKEYDLWDVGSGWAREAQASVVAALDDMSVRRLMCLVLLYEHAARTGETRQCFQLSALASRMTQALSLNLEHDEDVLDTSQMSAVSRESRRRLMWACYLLDTMLACGLRDLQVLETASLRIQLPCDERHFVYKVAVHTAMVDTTFAPRRSSRKGPLLSTNQGIDAFSVRLYLIRDHVLQYINSDTDKDDPWRLVALIADLEAWKDALTPELQFTSDVLAVRKDEGRLAALVSLHVLYHQVNCLLYRCTIPSMLFPARTQTGLSVKASPDFLAESRKGWFGHACAMSAIFEVSLQHQPLSMTDPAVAPSAYNAIIIKWLYLTNFVSTGDEKQHQLNAILPLVDIDLQFLQALASYHPSVGTIASVAARLVDEAKRRIAANPVVRLSETGIPDQIHSATSISPDVRMNQLSTFARMRKTIPDVHAPDRGTPTTSPGLSTYSSPQSDWAGEERLWMWSE